MDLKTRLSNARQKLPLLRRSSQHSTATRSLASSAGSDRGVGGGCRSSLPKSVSLTKLPAVSSESVASGADQRMSQSAVLPHKSSLSANKADVPSSGRTEASSSSTSRGRHPSDTTTANTAKTDQSSPAPVRTARPAVTVEEPTPVRVPTIDTVGLEDKELTQQQSPRDRLPEHTGDDDHPTELRPAQTRPNSKPAPIRRQSLVTASNARVIHTLLEPDLSHTAVASGPSTAGDYFAGAPSFNAGMLHRKIWVKRPNASATLVQVKEDDLVDDVRDMILRKYANSLGKAYDSPDITLRIQPRDQTSKATDRVLGPEEEMCRTLDAYFPGGQTVSDALLIEVPHRRTPKPSPRVHYSYHDESRAHQLESTGYFPPMPVVHPSPAMSVLSTGHVPEVPSPGSAKRVVAHVRPRVPRQHTQSPTTLSASVSAPSTSSRIIQRPRHDSSSSDPKRSPSSGNPSLPTPPAPASEPARQTSNPPTPRVASPRLKERRKKLKAAETPSLPPGLLDNTVPPINVLIVEDNIINLRVLGAFMQRLKVRWQRAMNGKEAVTKWRAGGFHLVLMDIQLPIMNGLEATKEIRRLERVNSIGVFSSGSSEAPNNRLGDQKSCVKELSEDDKLGDKSLFKSPVIIVALTASSLQSDRHEALAAGCNDFLTKPVNFVWLERKVKEWGCMQALIDYDGWRKWKDFASTESDAADTARASTGYSTYAARPQPPTLSAVSPTASAPTPNGVTSSVKSPEEERRNKRRSLISARPPPLPEEESSNSTPDANDS